MYKIYFMMILLDKNTKIYPLDKVEYRQSKTMNALRNRSESSFIAGMNILNNQFSI